MEIIQTLELRKIYSSIHKESGVKGSIKGLFSRQTVDKVAVDGINLSIQEGELVGFLGPNGAGKTTTLKILSGIMHPTSGVATVMGHQPWKRERDFLSNISLVVGNKQQLWWDLPAWDSFVVLKTLYNVPDAEFKSRVTTLCEALDLSDKLHVQVRKMSLGERMKCELVAAILHRPKVMFLDEPTLGLDVISQKRIRDFLKELNQKEGCTMLLTSHYMQDVQELCERVIIIDKGKVRFDGSLESLLAQYGESRRVKLTLSKPVSREDAEKFGFILELSEGELILDVPNAEVAKVTSAALVALPVLDLSVESVEIEEVIRMHFSANAE